MSDLRSLKDRAQKLLEKGKLEQAVSAFAELARLEPQSSRWPQKLGELHRKLGQTEAAISAFVEAARLLGEEGFLVKAIALCKVALGIDPGHARAQELLGRLCGQPGGSLHQPAGVVIPALPQLPAEPAAEGKRPKRRTIPPGGYLADVSLAEVVPDARQQATASGQLFEIPLDEEELELAVERPPTEAERRLSTTPLFSALDHDALHQLVSRLQVRSYPPGARIIAEGQAGDSLFVIGEGEVVVHREGPPAVELGYLGEGEFFGEFAWVTERRRSANVDTIGPLTALEISREVMADVVDEHPLVLKVLLRFFRERMVQNLTSSSELFDPFTEEERRALAARFAFLEVEASAQLISEGEPADGLYLLLCGELLVFRGERQIAVLGPGSVVGEISLLTHGPAVASIWAAGKCWALRLPRADFQEIILTHPQVLAFLSELAAQRQAHGAALAAGEIPYEERRLEII